MSASLVSNAKSKWYVYELRDPRNGLTFYVGKGKANRMFDHVLAARAGKRGRKCDLIRLIEAEGSAVQAIEVARFWNEDAAYLHEADRIADYGLENLTNVIPGGTGAYERYKSALGRKKRPAVTPEQVVLSCVASLRRVIQMRIDGKRVWKLGHEWVVPSSNMAMSLRDRVGHAFFDSHVFGLAA